MTSTGYCYGLYTIRKSSIQKIFARWAPSRQLAGLEMDFVLEFLRLARGDRMNSPPSFF
jgi:hypothetical protein